MYFLKESAQSTQNPTGQSELKLSLQILQ